MVEIKKQVKKFFLEEQGSIKTKSVLRLGTLLSLAGLSALTDVNAWSRRIELDRDMTNANTNVMGGKTPDQWVGGGHSGMWKCNIFNLNATEMNMLPDGYVRPPAFLAVDHMSDHFNDHHSGGGDHVSDHVSDHADGLNTDHAWSGSHKEIEIGAKHENSMLVDRIGNEIVTTHAHSVIPLEYGCGHLNDHGSDHLSDHSSGGGGDNLNDHFSDHFSNAAFGGFNIWNLAFGPAGFWL